MSNKKQRNIIKQLLNSAMINNPKAKIKIRMRETFSRGLIFFIVDINFGNVFLDKDYTCQIGINGGMKIMKHMFGSYKNNYERYKYPELI